MSQNKEALQAELRELTQELEEMREQFLQNDGVIDATERAALNEINQEIDNLKEEISELEFSISPDAEPVNFQDSLAQNTLDPTISNILNPDFGQMAIQQEFEARDWLKTYLKDDMHLTDIVREVKEKYPMLMVDDLIIRIIKEVAEEQNVKIWEPIPGVSPTPIPESSGGGGLGELTKFHFMLGNSSWDIDITSEFKIQLPVALRTGRLVFELKGAYSGDFSFSIKLDGTEHFTLESITKYSISDNEIRTGLTASTTKKICTGANPETVRANIISKGEDLKKAMEALPDGDVLDTAMDLKDVVSAIADMYSEVEKLKGSCSEVPVFSVGAETVIPLGDENDRHPSVNFSFTLHF